jgi:hypothetical protein
VGHNARNSEAINADGSVLIFGSNQGSLNPVGGSDNDGTFQIYRYDDADRSVLCVTCPQDGSPPVAAMSPELQQGSIDPVGANTVQLSADGDFVFETATPLVPQDQNTDLGQPRSGQDIYEWRDGRLLLVTDGTSSWPLAGQLGATPEVAGITPSGDDIFFLNFSPLTPDALDGYLRLYTARIGGGFEFPQPPEPCPLELCQGPPSPVPNDPGSGSSDFQGSGNRGKDRTPPGVSGPKKCPKGKKLKKGKCVKKKKKRKRKGGKRK